MTSRASMVRRRSGFTLIELLVVIAVIVILAALLLPAISRVYFEGRRVRVVSEITQIGLALDAFNNQYHMYPPSRIRLRENTAYNPADPLDLESVKFLKVIFPDIHLPNGLPDSNPAARVILWCKDNPNKTEATVLSSSGTAGSPGSTSGTTYELEGFEALVFFLGGIAEFDRSKPNPLVTLHGFSQRPNNPGGVPDTTRPATLARQKILYNFDPGRLFLRPSDAIAESLDVGASSGANYWNGGTDPDGTLRLPAAKAAAILPCYRPVNVEGNKPYAYFSSYSGRGYRPADCVYPDQLTVNFQHLWPGIQVVSNVLGPNPYTQTLSNPAAPTVVKCYAPQTYQLITPGADGDYGSGGQLKALLGTPEKYISSDPDADNVANFSDGKTIQDFNSGLLPQ